MSFLPSSLRAFAGRRLGPLGPAFQLLLLSDGLMLLSLMVGHVAVPWWVAHEGGAAQLAIYAAGMAAGSFIALPLLSPLGDRVSKRRLIAGGLLLMALEALVLAALAQLGIYRLAWVMGLELLAVVAMAAIMPASFSIVAELLPAERLTEGLGLQKSAQALGRLLGPALGGLVLAAASTAVALWLHAALLLLAAALAARIQAPTPPAPAQASHWLADLRAGLVAKWKIPLERGWTFVSFLVMIFFTPGIGMLVPLKVQSLGLSAAWLGACEAGLSLGMLLGSLGGSVWLAQRIGRFNASFAAILLEGLCMIAIGFSEAPLLIVAGFAMLGACIATVQMVGQTHRMLAMPQAFRARMTAVNMMVMQIAGVLGPGLAGGLLLQGSVGGAYGLFGLGLFLVGLGYLWVPGYREFLNLPHAQAEGRYAREHPGLFNR
ncbi:MFS transporter [Roseateles violae]|uniref:MFS transporter n=1 Tax=Roseateles violae TaxID=3058042 RepID=A0ABT8DP65_9BURK|nr:MFS transporter [Pelomonas sp. PFR6]MDN3918840.1 MFS transporter [Pelomonas sp. PFR6]